MAIFVKSVNTPFSQRFSLALFYQIQGWNENEAGHAIFAQASYVFLRNNLLGRLTTAACYVSIV